MLVSGDMLSATVAAAAVACLQSFAKPGRRPPACTEAGWHLTSTSPMLLPAGPNQHQKSMSGTMQAPCLQAGSRFQDLCGSLVLKAVHWLLAAGSWQLPAARPAADAAACTPASKAPQAGAGQGRHTGGQWHRLPACL
jgi:hypothetical protein